MPRRTSTARVRDAKLPMFSAPRLTLRPDRLHSLLHPYLTHHVISTVCMCYENEDFIENIYEYISCILYLHLVFLVLEGILGFSTATLTLLSVL